MMETGRNTQNTEEDGPPGFSDVHTPMLACSPESSTRIKPRTYDGSGPWKEYVHYFERLGRLNQWRTADKLELLWIHLEGTALSYVENLPEGSITTYDELCGTLESRFGEQHLAELFKAELRARCRRPGESLPELGQDIRRLVMNAYPRIKQEGLEELAVERFRQAIRDSSVRLAVFQSKPKTLDEVVRAAVDAESWCISEGQHTREQVRAAGEAPGITMEQLAARLQQLSETMEKMEENRRGGRRSYNNVLCYNCQKEGHIARNCPTKKAAKGSGNDEGLH